jgi:hypothetical protein
MLFETMKKIMASILFINIAYAQVTYNEFQSLQVALHTAFIELRPTSNDILKINMKVGDIDDFWWNLTEAHASYSQAEQAGNVEHNIFLFGGFARLDQMTLDGLALTACHEIGHGLGGKPEKISGNTVEGESDYYATKTCLPIVIKYLADSTPRSQNNYIHNKCEESSYPFDTCIRLFTAIESDISFFKTLGDTTSFENYSSHIAETLDLSPKYYPDSQCRIDTMIHGVLNLNRPKCWFPGGIERSL